MGERASPCSFFVIRSFSPLRTSFLDSFRSLLSVCCLVIVFLRSFRVRSLRKSPPPKVVSANRRAFQIASSMIFLHPPPSSSCSLEHPFPCFIKDSLPISFLIRSIFRIQRAASPPELLLPPLRHPPPPKGCPLPSFQFSSTFYNCGRSLWSSSSKTLTSRNTYPDGGECPPVPTHHFRLFFFLLHRNGCRPARCWPPEPGCSSNSVHPSPSEAVPLPLYSF